jgi:inosose dehydratase
MQPARNRRQFLQLAAVTAAASLAEVPFSRTAEAGPGAGAKPKFQLGMASYTFLKFDVDQAIKMTARLGLKRICLKDVHLPLNSGEDHIKEVIGKIKTAGLDLYAGGVIYMKTETDVRQAFDYAKAAGMKIIVGVPNHEFLPLVDKMARQYDISVAIHNHGPTDQVYPTPQSAYDRIRDLDKRIGLCIDAGHAMRSGIDPSEPAEKYADRLLDLHVKDVSAATARGSTVEMGRGVIDLPKLFRTLTRIGYAGIVSFEHEKDSGDPLPGVAESVGYARGILAAL